MEIASRGAVLVCGGLGGLMEAACRGAESGGGITMGILPGDDPSHTNPYVKIPLATVLGEARNAIIVKSADAIISIGGKFGTLIEIAFALKSNKTMLGINIWQLSRKGKIIRSVLETEDAAEAVTKAIYLAKSRPQKANK